MKLNPIRFVAQVDGVFANALASFGFKFAREHHHEEFFACSTFRADDRYVQINANCYFRDGQPQCQIVLGDGPHEWPDRDWNALALWQLSEIGENYPIGRVEDIPSILVTMRQDRLENAQDFLSGDLNRFLKRRAALNREREPYLVHSPQPDGTYQAKYEPESRSLKEKYSHEKKA